MLTKGLPKNVFMKLHAVIGLVKFSGYNLGGALKRALLHLNRTNIATCVTFIQ